MGEHGTWFDYLNRFEWWRHLDTWAKSKLQRTALLGMFETPTLRDVDVVLAHEDALVAYTDGVVEEREGDEFFGEGRLRTVLGACDGVSAADIAERIVRAVEAFRPDPPADDIAVLAMRAVPIKRRVA